MKFQHTIVIPSIISIISVFTGMSLLMTGSAAQHGQTETNIESPQFLAILHAESGSISEINQPKLV